MSYGHQPGPEDSFSAAASQVCAIAKEQLFLASAPHPAHTQADETRTSIGEAIRQWYGIQKSRDFERVDVDAAIHPDGHFILIPTALILRGPGRTQTLEKVVSPLSFHHDYQSKFWKQQIESCRKSSASDVSWAGAQIKRVVADHQKADTKNVHEADLLRTAGALAVLGVDLSLYLVKGYDCPKSQSRRF